MHWVSDVCVLLRCSDLINKNYDTYQAVAGQFSVLKPYQASSLQPIASTPAEPASPTHAVPQGIAGHKRAAEQHIQLDTGLASPAEASGEQQSERACKRSRKGLPEPQAKGRQIQAQQRHDVWQPTLLAAYHIFQQHLQEAGSCSSILQADPLPGTAQPISKQAKEPTSTEEHDLLDLVSLHELKYTLRPKFAFVSGHTTEAANSLFDTLICNKDNSERLGVAFGHRVLIPAQATFLLSDIKKLGPLLPGKGHSGFHCIVLDPPWENKSAKRGGKYPTLPSRNLKAIPLQQLMHKGGAVVAMWVTNRERHMRFIHEELLPHWGLTHTATWLWLKVTNSGELVSPMEIAHRRPYEVLMLLQPTLDPPTVLSPFNTTSDDQQTSAEKHSMQLPANSSTHASGKGMAAPPDVSSQRDDTVQAIFSLGPSGAQPSSSITGAGDEHSDVMRQATNSAVAVAGSGLDPVVSHSLPNGVVMIAVPGEHSRKPQLSRLLQPYLPAKPKCLEMFARELTPGWTSWGNQVLHFQQMHFFDQQSGPDNDGSPTIQRPGIDSQEMTGTSP